MINRFQIVILMLTLFFPVCLFAESGLNIKEQASPTPRITVFSKEHLDDLIAQLEDPVEATRLKAVQEIGSQGLQAKSVVDNLDKFLFSSLCNSPQLRAATIEALGNVQGKKLTTVDVEIQVRKPAIYLYPNKLLPVSIEVITENPVSIAFPIFAAGTSRWDITAHPNGQLEDAQGRFYRYLFWEGSLRTMPFFAKEEGFVVKGEEALSFLESTLSKIGLSVEESNDFIVYWYPYLQRNKLNYVYFLTEGCEQVAHLKVSPVPESVLRVLMILKPIDKEFSVRPQLFKGFNRTGFTLVEWGGIEMGVSDRIQVK